MDGFWYHVSKRFAAVGDSEGFTVIHPIEDSHHMATEFSFSNDMRHKGRLLGDKCNVVLLCDCFKLRVGVCARPFCRRGSRF